MRRVGLALLGMVGGFLLAQRAQGAPPLETRTTPSASRDAKKAEEGIVIDRVAVRFSAPEGGGRERPYFIYERELAFEARLVALADLGHDRRAGPYRRHHVQAAMERRIAETLLASNAIDPPPEPSAIEKQMSDAKQLLIIEIGGDEALLAAARAEGIDSLELRHLFRRRALASLYLDRMVTPMLEPSLLELRRVHRRGEGPLPDRPFAEAMEPLRKWYVARSLRNAVGTYYQNARARLLIEFPQKDERPRSRPRRGALGPDR